MAFILDHLTAILVGASLLSVLLFVQQRGQQTAFDSTVHHNLQLQSSSIMETLERDLENMRSSAQTGEKTRVSWSGDNTTELRFLTLADPDLGDASDLIAVTYKLEDTERQIDINGTQMTLYRLGRYVNDGLNDVYDGGSTEILVGFKVSLISRDASNAVTNGDEPDNFGIVRVELEAAMEHVGRLAGDQDNTSRKNQTRQAFTFRPAALATEWVEPDAPEDDEPPVIEDPEEDCDPPWLPVEYPPAGDIDDNGDEIRIFDAYISALGDNTLTIDGIVFRVVSDTEIEAPSGPDLQFEDLEVGMFLEEIRADLVNGEWEAYRMDVEAYPEPEPILYDSCHV